MSFSGTTYTPPSGAENAAAGQIVQSAVWNAIHTDIASALTQLMSQLVTLNTNRNILWMNGGFEIWQQGAGASASIAVAASTTSYTADRWYLTTGANQASVVSAQSGLSSQSQLCARVLRNAAQTGTTAMTFGYPLDTDELYRIRGKKISLSFLVSTGANWSPASGTLTATLYVGTGAVAKRGAGFTGETTVLTIATNLAAGASAAEVSGNSSAVVPATSTQGEVQFTWTPVGTAGAADSFSVDDIQIEPQLATTWTPMDFDRLDFATMLAGCKRSFWKTFPYEVAPASGGSTAVNTALAVMPQAAEKVQIFVQYPVEMRTNPSFTKYCPTTVTSSNWIDIVSGVTVSASIDFTNNTNATKGIAIYFSASVTATALGRNLYIHIAASAGI